MIKRVLKAIQGLDRSVVCALERRRRPWLTSLVSALTWTAATPGWAVLVAVTFYAAEARAAWLPAALDVRRALVGCGIAFIIGTILKRVVGRARPFAAGDVKAGVWAPGPYHSFPSTHASSSVALATGLSLRGHPWSLPAWLWAVLVSCSRPYLGVHYLSDVLAGALMGATSAGLALYC